MAAAITTPPSANPSIPSMNDIARKPARSGPIEMLRRQRPCDLRREIVPLCWTRRPDALAPLVLPDALGPLARLLPASPVTLPQHGDGALFVMLASGAPLELIDAVTRAAADGRTVVVLAEGDAVAARLVPLHGVQMLVRTAPDVPATVVMAGRGARCELYLAAHPAAAPCWRLRLSERQGERLFQAALHLFWHTAELEACGESRLRPVMQRPFDVAAPADELVQLSRALAPAGAAEQVYDEMGSDALDESTRLAVSSPELADATALRPIVERGGEVVWYDLGLPVVRLGAGRGSLDMYGAGGMGLRLGLDAEQSAAFASIFEQVRGEAPVRLRVGACLRELEGELRRPRDDDFVAIESRLELDAGTLTANSLAEALSLEPTTWPTTSRVALERVDTWQVRVPLAPKKASPDPLHNAWQRFSDVSTARVEAAGRALGELASRGHRLAQQYPSLKTARVGWERRGRELTARHGALDEARRGQLTPEAARGFVTALEGVEEAVEAWDGELDASEDKAQREAARAKLRREWQRRHDEAARELEKIERRELPAAREKLADLEQRLAANLDEEETALNALHDEATAAVARLEQRIESLRAELAEEFVFDESSAAAGTAPQAVAGHLFVPENRQSRAPRALTVPPEALPEVGELLVHGGRRYLAIALWEELASGEREAERLGAELVASRRSAS